MSGSFFESFFVLKETFIINKLIYFIVISLLFISCKKDRTSSPVVGQWEWYKASGGIGNINQTPQNSGHTWQLTLSSDYKSSQTGDLMPAGNGTFTLTDDMGSVPPRQLLNITTNGTVSSFHYSFISNDSLRLDQHVEADGLSYFLVRK